MIRPGTSLRSLITSVCGPSKDSRTGSGRPTLKGSASSRQPSRRSSAPSNAGVTPYTHMQNAQSEPDRDTTGGIEDPLRWDWMLLGAAIGHTQNLQKYGREKAQEKLAVLCKTIVLQMLDEGSINTASKVVREWEEAKLTRRNVDGNDLRTQDAVTIVASTMMSQISLSRQSPEKGEL
ncbi:hypothetical protein QFC20_003854 [Naganishia adeliensis]|uniref:Uncharacterized protein n=1 Tax=Naganishia adeliensis TaxID=92952 RepID=A0ACC2W713_9TREE|nr:hypothetical protein QFC20_003854 [Naganishia adeliensis]